MKFIREIHEECEAAQRPAISFEFFPPRTAEGDRSLLEKTIPALRELQPDYCSVTYGAGGTTREKTVDIVDQIQRVHGLPAMMHLTCVGSTREQLREVVEEARSRGIQNLLALRGDPPPGRSFRRPKAASLTRANSSRFCGSWAASRSGPAGFPEGHIACLDGKITDWQFLRAKVEAGADFILTQLFFDNEDFYAFHEHLTKELGIRVPIIPGVAADRFCEPDETLRLDVRRKASASLPATARGAGRR
jgi:methylenetetrahydrofolate reductase (NADPH)